MRFLAALTGLAFLTLAILFLLEKAPKRIIDFQRINREEKGTLRIDRLSRNIGIVLLLLSGIFFAAGFSAVFKERYFLFAVIGWVALVFFDIWFIGKSKRYKR